MAPSCGRAAVGRAAGAPGWGGARALASSAHLQEQQEIYSELLASVGDFTSEVIKGPVVLTSASHQRHGKQL